MKIQEKKKLFAFYYMLGFFGGILYANFQSKDYITSMGIFNEYFLRQYSIADIDTIKYLWYVMKIRLGPVILLSALGSTRMRKGVVSAFLLWTGFSSGLLLTSAVMKMGIKGVLLCFIALIPHFVFYVAGYLLLLWYIFSYPEIRWNPSKTVVFLLSLGLGILLEAYVNPVIMQMFVRTL